MNSPLITDYSLLILPLAAFLSKRQLHLLRHCCRQGHCLLRMTDGIDGRWFKAGGNNDLHAPGMRGEQVIDQLGTIIIF